MRMHIGQETIYVMENMEIREVICVMCINHHNFHNYLSRIRAANTLKLLGCKAGVLQVLFHTIPTRTQNNELYLHLLHFLHLPSVSYSVWSMSLH